jgi:hypothetical protein
MSDFEIGSLFSYGCYKMPELAPFPGALRGQPPQRGVRRTRAAGAGGRLPPAKASPFNSMSLCRAEFCGILSGALFQLRLVR